jgi:hypothetical protein
MPPCGLDGGTSAHSLKGGAVMSRYVFHVVFFSDRGWWVAQCLERNLATASKDPRELRGKLETVLRVQIEADRDAGVEPFVALPQAPRRFWRMFQTAGPWRLEDKTAEPSVSIPMWAELAIAY